MLIDKAKSFIQTMYSELKYNTNEIENRMKEIEQEINLTGSYTHTYEELSYGAKMAWRNSNRCIGRLFWDSLNVKDARDVCDEKEFIKSIHTHMYTHMHIICPLMSFLNKYFKGSFWSISIAFLHLLKTISL